MKKTLAFALLALSGMASAENLIGFPGSAGQPASENDPTHSYQCFNDGNSIYANTTNGYGRCRAVFPLSYEGPMAVMSVKAHYSSADKISYAKVQLFKVMGFTTVSIGAAIDLSSSESVEETLAVFEGEPVVPGQAIYAVVEVRGDTRLHSVVFDVLPL